MRMRLVLRRALALLTLSALVLLASPAAALDYTGKGAAKRGPFQLDSKFNIVTWEWWPAGSAAYGNFIVDVYDSDGELFSQPINVGGYVNKGATVLESYTGRIPDDDYTFDITEYTNGSWELRVEPAGPPVDELSFGGAGSAAVGPFYLPGGRTELTWDEESAVSGNFIVRLVKSGGERCAIPVNELGTGSSGTVVIDSSDGEVEPGYYMLSITAGAADAAPRNGGIDRAWVEATWSVTLTPPDNPPAPEPPSPDDQADDGTSQGSTPTAPSDTATAGTGVPPIGGAAAGGTGANDPLPYVIGIAILLGSAVGMGVHVAGKPKGAVTAQGVAQSPRWAKIAMIVVAVVTVLLVALVLGWNALGLGGPQANAPGSSTTTSTPRAEVDPKALPITTPAAGDAVRTQLMDSARLRLGIQDKFIVKGLFVQGDRAVGILTPDGGTERHLVAWKRAAGGWEVTWNGRPDAAGRAALQVAEPGLSKELVDKLGL